MTTKAYTGGCACGAIRYEIAADPIMAGHCQCRDCQYDSGTGHASHLAFPRAAARLSGPATHWDKPAASGNMVTRAFCPTCGTPVYSTNAAMPDLVFVRAASLDDPARFVPQLVVWTRSGQAWDTLDPTLPKFETMPAM
ncbi:GFA family protein [Aquabacter spiritensis]|uniref:CENP-V/GFA domain-containing protein n=1 Tax=Aquabacter spiritensis TaxID=933073 RepID=A0A4R3LPB2_9HYPH|nr:GFA family protein [Aquabacter spiritensis]TCT02274.1 hypothetical protein EDC64_114135 [Aquabacter spiritensis]